MPYASATQSRRPNLARHHGIRPAAAVAYRHDWGEQALQKTWRSAGVFLMLVGLINTFVSRLPATLFFLLGIWAHLKGNPVMRDKLAAHPVLGAPLRWWLSRGRRERGGMRLGR